MYFGLWAPVKIFFRQKIPLAFCRGPVKFQERDPPHAAPRASRPEQHFHAASEWFHSRFRTFPQQIPRESKWAPGKKNPRGRIPAKKVDGQTPATPGYY